MPVLQTSGTTSHTKVRSTVPLGRKNALNSVLAVSNKSRTTAERGRLEDAAVSHTEGRAGRRQANEAARCHLPNSYGCAGRCAGVPCGGRPGGRARAAGRTQSASRHPTLHDDCDRINANCDSRRMTKSRGQPAILPDRQQHHTRVARVAGMQFHRRFPQGGRKKFKNEPSIAADTAHFPVKSSTTGH